jgi:hypothetical protein
LIPTGFIAIGTAYSKLFQRFSSEAASRLAYCLNTGELQAYCFDHQGNENRLSIKVWQRMPESGRLDIFKTGTALHDNVIKTIVLREDDFAKAFPEKVKATLVNPSEAHPITSRGRPNKYDPETIWATIVWIQYHEGLPQTQAAAIDMVQQKYAEFFGLDLEPSRSTLQPTIKRCLSMLNGASPSEVFPSYQKPKAGRRKVSLNSIR